MISQHEPGKLVMNTFRVKKVPGVPKVLRVLRVLRVFVLKSNINLFNFKYFKL